jgi:pyruvate carboxylase subunit B
MEKARADTEGVARDIGDVLIYALYPTTGMRFLKWKYSDDPKPAEWEIKTLEDIAREDEMAARAKAGELAEPKEKVAPSGSPNGRAFNVFVDGEHFRVRVEEEGARPTVPATTAPPRPASAPAPAPEQAPTPPASSATGIALEAPMPAMVVRYEVEEGATVKTGDAVVVIEAMKMQSTISSPENGVVSSLPCAPGTSVKRGDVLATIEPQ